MTATVESLAAAGALSLLDVHLASTLGRLGGETRAEVLLAVALASQHVASGNVCVDLRAPITPEPGGASAPAALPPSATWIDAVRSSPLVSDGSGPERPLVLDGDGRLYLRRHWEHERALGDRLHARAGACADALDSRCFREGLDRLLPRAPGIAGPDWQRVAAYVGLRRRLCVITGGPGTGKTTTVVRIVALRIEQSLAAGALPPRIMLAAPTGKAAARLTEAIRRVRSALPCAPAVLAALPDEARTIHRVLGASPAGRRRFRHDAANPLRTDLLIVDEASMVDLALMARVVAALPDTASLILLGDKDQLASVEAGAVLADLCQGDGRGTRSPAFTAEVVAATGEPLPAAGPAATPGIRDCIVELTHSHRYAAHGDIGALALAIRAGDAERVLALLDAPEHPSVSRVTPGTSAMLARLRDVVLDGYGPYLRAAGGLKRLAALDRFRILSALRQGPEGVAALNLETERLLAVVHPLALRETFYAGRPVMVTRNDYQLGVFNGDVGTIADTAPGDPTRLAIFAAPDGGGRILSPARLPPCETAFALTVHKSQGSEFDSVLLVLPRRPAAAVSRELLYTGVSRARAAVTIVAGAEVVRQAVRTPVRRLSGLGRRLWGDDGPGRAG